MSASVLHHLLEPEFTALANASVETLLGAQAQTASDLIDFNAHEDVLTEMDRQGAQRAFAAATAPEADHTTQQAALMALRVPQAVKHLAGMLSQYDWAFVEQAKEIRGYVVAQLLEETKNPDAKVRLRALELTGKLTEVGSFTERISITKTDASSAELEERIRARLAKIIPPAREVQDVTPRVSEPAEFSPPAAEPHPTTQES